MSGIPTCALFCLICASDDTARGGEGGVVGSGEGNLSLGGTDQSETEACRVGILGAVFLGDVNLSSRSSICCLEDANLNSQLGLRLRDAPSHFLLPE